MTTRRSMQPKTIRPVQPLKCEQYGTDRRIRGAHSGISATGTRSEVFPILISGAIFILIVGFLVGYAVRAGVSRRRHAEARLRYHATGSTYR